MPRSLRAPLTALALAAAALVPVARAQPRSVSAAPARESVTVTVYNQEFGLVREVRSVDLGQGTVALEFADVAATIQPETVHVSSLDDPQDLRVLEQSYQYDLLNPRKLLEKYVGRRVVVQRWNEKEGRDEALEAEVLAANDGAILRIGDQITFDIPGRISFPEIPENLIAKPTLVWLLESRRARQRVEVSYLAGKLGWHADYVLVLAPDESKGDLTGWVTLQNESGATYQNARLKLVAGDVQRVQPEAPPVLYDRMATLEAAPAAAFREEGLLEYHLYTLERPTTIRDRETKQVTLLEAPGVGVVKRLAVESQPHWFRGHMPGRPSKEKVGVFIDLENSEANGLGRPLPAGIVRLYRADSDGAQQFVGEDRIDHTPRDEKVSLKAGDAFDVVAERKQTDFRALGQCSSESAFEIALRNHKEEPVEVEVIEHADGDWEIVQSSMKAEKQDAFTFRFRVPVMARGEAKVSYRVRVRWC